MSRSIRYLVLVAVCGLLLIPAAAFAHEHRDVGNYEFVVGFKNEPAFQGEQNGIWLKITDKASGQPVENVQDTLKAQVIKGAQQRELPLEPAFGEKGVYTTNFYPTEAGDYTFRFFGTINGNQIDEKFTSSPTGFSSVEASEELQFPVKVPAATELSAQLAAAQSTAQTAMILGGAGLAVGLLGLIAAIVAFRGRQAGAARRESSVARSS